MRFFRSSSVLGIAAEALEFVQNAARETHPNEYMGFLRAEEASRLGLDERGRVITDVLVIPGTVSDPQSATVRENMKPNDRNVVGSVHSHPNGVIRPSQADLETFHSGSVHIILGSPYGRHDWQAFDENGDPRELAVIDVDLPDPEAFFDFTEEDLDLE
jgi:proteasome lid subunit RPN8/RPN11